MIIQRYRHLGLASALCILGGLVIVGAAHADDVRVDDLIITGNACIGTDCVNGENLEATSLRLKENNTRIRLYNTATADTLGKSWSLEANDSSNGGPSAFRFKAQSLTQDSIKLSDGQDVGADCEAGEIFELELELSDVPQRFSLLPASVPVPVGEAVNRYEETGGPVVNGGLYTYQYTCFNTDWWTEDLLLRLGNANDDLVTLGRTSAPVPGAVSVGNASASRTIKHVALPEAGTDILPVEALSLLPDRKARIKTLRATISDLEVRLAALESADADNDSVPNGADAFPTDPTESADSDGDGIGDNADTFVNAVTRAADQGATLTATPVSATSSCSVSAFSVGAVDNERAPGPSITRQAEFTLNNCAPGESVMVSIDFGEAFPPRPAAFKLNGSTWTKIDGATVNGQTISYTIQDNGPLDLDPAEGVIADPVSVATGPVEPIPLPFWLLVVLAGSLGWLASRSHRRNVCAV